MFSNLVKRIIKVADNFFGNGRVLKISTWAAGQGRLRERPKRGTRCSGAWIPRDK